MVDKKSKILSIIFIFLVTISIAVTYYRYIVLKDFDILTDEELFNESLEE